MHPSYVELKEMQLKWFMLRAFFVSPNFRRCENQILQEMNKDKSRKNGQETLNKYLYIKD